MRIKDASSIVLIDRNDDEPRVLMGKRASSHKFMPDVFVFPGGRVDYADRFVGCTGNYSEDTLDLLLQKMAGRASALRARMMGVAAIRETFEEVGLRIGSHKSSDRRPKQTIWQDFETTGLEPDLSKLDLLARAITPPGQKRRFDTRFFITDFSEESAAQNIKTSGELEEVHWVSLEEAFKLKTHFITKQILSVTRDYLAATNAPAPVPFYRAKPGSGDKAKLLTHLRPYQDPVIVGEIATNL